MNLAPRKGSRRSHQVGHHKWRPRANRMTRTKVPFGAIQVPVPMGTCAGDLQKISSVLWNGTRGRAEDRLSHSGCLTITSTFCFPTVAKLD